MATLSLPWAQGPALSEPACGEAGGRRVEGPALSEPALAKPEAGESKGKMFG